MTKQQKDKYLGYVICCTFITCYICAVFSHDIPSYEQDYLVGEKWLLHWCMVIYLPLFPLISGIFVILITKTVMSIAVTATNFLLTLMFTIFACSSGILSTSWIYLSFASFVIMLGAIYDKYNPSKTCKENNTR